MSTTTNLNTLKINYLTQAQYDAASSGGTINENELYLTPQPTTLSGYGITDASISSGVITLGSNTLTPVERVTTSTSSGVTTTNTINNTSNHILLDTVDDNSTPNHSYIDISPTKTYISSSTIDLNGAIEAEGSINIPNSSQYGAWNVASGTAVKRPLLRYSSNNNLVLGSTSQRSDYESVSSGTGGGVILEGSYLYVSTGSDSSETKTFGVDSSGNTSVVNNLSVGGTSSLTGKVTLGNNLQFTTGNRAIFDGSTDTVKIFGGVVSGDQNRLYLAGGRIMFRNYTDASTYTTMAQITSNGIISATHATGSDSAAIGYTTYGESSTSQSLTTDTAKELASTTLGAGQWVVVGTARFTGGASSGNNGVKALGILTGTSTLSTSTPAHMRVYATANWTQVLCTTRILNLTASTTVTLQGLSTQSTPGSVAWYSWRWIRIA